MSQDAILQGPRVLREPVAFVIIEVVPGKHRSNLHEELRTEHNRSDDLESESVALLQQAGPAGE